MGCSTILKSMTSKGLKRTFTFLARWAILAKLLYVVAGMGGALLIGVTYMLRVLPKDSRKIN
jgi:hypothetical protein